MEASSTETETDDPDPEASGAFLFVPPGFEVMVISESRSTGTYKLVPICHKPQSEQHSRGQT